MFYYIYRLYNKLSLVNEISWRSLFLLDFCKHTKLFIYIAVAVFLHYIPMRSIVHSSMFVKKLFIGGERKVHKHEHAYTYVYKLLSISFGYHMLLKIWYVLIRPTIIMTSGMRVVCNVHRFRVKGEIQTRVPWHITYNIFSSQMHER